eukprot:6211949-Pleurochrysis_carterae.AAC.1
MSKEANEQCVPVRCAQGRHEGLGSAAGTCKTKRTRGVSQKIHCSQQKIPQPHKCSTPFKEIAMDIRQSNSWSTTAACKNSPLRSRLNGCLLCEGCEGAPALNM